MKLMKSGFTVSVILLFLAACSGNERTGSRLDGSPVGPDGSRTVVDASEAIDASEAVDAPGSVDAPGPVVDAPSGSSPFGAGPHEPVGLKAFYSFDPAKYSSLDSALGGSGNKWTYSGSAASRFSIVTDAGAPDGKALKWSWNTGDACLGGGNVSWNFVGGTPDPSLYPGWAGTLPKMQRFYLHYSIYIASSFVLSGGGAKQIGFNLDQGDTSLHHYIGWYTNSERIRFQNIGVLWQATAPDTSGWSKGTWYDVEYVFKAQSVPGVADGSFFFWRNGTKVTQWHDLTGGSGYSDGTDVKFVPDTSPGTAIKRIHQLFFNGGSPCGTQTTNSYILFGGIYMSGSGSL